MENTVVYPKFRWLVGLAEAWACLTFGLTILTFSPMLPVIARDLSRPTGSLVIGLFGIRSFACGFGVIGSGPLVDRFGPRKMLLWSSILMLLSCVLIPFCSHSVGPFVALRIFQGLAVGPVFSAMASLTHRWFPHNEQGTVMGINNGAIAVGIAMVFLTVAPLMQALHGDWRMVAALSGVLLAIQVVLMVIVLMGKAPAMVRRTPPAGAASGNYFLIALKLPAFWAGAILLSIAQGTMQSVSTVLPSYLMAPQPMGLGMRPMFTGQSMLLVQFGMIVSGMLMGFLLNYIFRGSTKWLAAVAHVAAGIVVYMVTLPFVHGQLAIMSVFLFLVGALMNLAFPAVSTYITANFPPQILGRVFAIASGISQFGAGFVLCSSGAILNMTHSFVVLYAFLLFTGVVGGIVAATMLNPVQAFRQAPAPSTAARAKNELGV